MRDTGGPAFPFQGVPTDGTGIDWEMPPFPGMTLDDYCVIEFSKALITGVKVGEPVVPLAINIIGEAEELAKVMIAGKRRREG